MSFFNKVNDVAYIESSTLSNKSFLEASTKCLLEISLKSIHSMIAVTVSVT